MRALGVCLTCAFCLLVSSCQQPNLQLMTSLDDAWRTIEPWAVQGVETDPALNEDQKEARLSLISDFGLTLKKGLENARGDE